MCAYILYRVSDFETSGIPRKESDKSIVGSNLENKLERKWKRNLENKVERNLENKVEKSRKEI